MLILRITALDEKNCLRPTCLARPDNLRKSVDFLVEEGILMQCVCLDMPCRELRISVSWPSTAVDPFPYIPIVPQCQS